MENSKIDLLVKAIFGLSLIVLVWGVISGNFFAVSQYVTLLWAVAILIKLIFQKKNKPAETPKK